MNENLLQFIWKFQYFNKADIRTQSGEAVEIIHPGVLNINQGPDFTNAKIKIDNTIWAGSVELHVKTSDWDKHGHAGDGNYNNVILHVVYEHDAEQSNIPLLELRDRIARVMLQRYNELLQSTQFIPCEGQIEKVPELIITNWKDRLIAGRLERKALLIETYFNQNSYHWEESFWWLLAKNFGAKTNATAFEAIAKTIPLKVLAKHKNQLIQLEALLLGQAGLLQNITTNDKYVLLLQKEYNFLKSKYSLQPVHFPVHFLRMRPGNFPTIRLSQLAALIFNSAHLFSKILEEPNLKIVKRLFAVTPNDFWKYHYSLQDESYYKEKPLGEDMINNIIINTVVPVLYVYGKVNHKQSIKNRALQWLEQTPPEKNTILKGFKLLGILNKNAYDSQALIELKTQFCESKKCLDCTIGNAVLKGI